MASERSRGWLQMLGSIVVLVGVMAGTVELLDYFGVRAKEVPALLLSALSSLRPNALNPSDTSKGPASTAVRAAARRPVRWVLILENTGDAEAMRKVARGAAAFAARLVPEDSVSLITFVARRHVWVFRDMSGARARDEIGRRARELFAAVQIPHQAAVEEAMHHLEQDPSPGKGAAVIVLSAADDEAMIGRWIQQAQVDAGATPRVLSSGGDTGAGTP